MSADPYTCAFCFSAYDCSTNQPRMLPCGHTFCTACIEKRVQESQETLSCFDDSCKALHPIPDKSLSTFSLNFALLQIMTLKAQKVVCPVHEKKMKIVCLVDKCKVCTHCVNFGDHKGHKIELMAKVIDDASKKTKSLQEGFSSLQEDCKQIENFHSEEKKAIVGEIKGWFKDLKAIVERKEQEAVDEMSQVFEEEGPRMREIAGFSGEYEKEVEEKIGSLKNIVTDQSGVDLLEDEEIEKKFVLMKAKLMGEKAEFAGRLERTSGMWEKSLLGVRRSVEGMEFLWGDRKKIRGEEGKENLGEGILRSESLNI